MKQIVVVNALGFGREVAEWIMLMPGYGLSFRLKGFLDDRAIPDTFKDLPILGSISVYHPGCDDYFSVALSDPLEKAKAVRLLDQTADRFFTVIHPENRISDSAKIGKGCILAPYNSVSSETDIGDYVCLYGFNRIGHNAKIGRFSHLASHIAIGGNAVVPEYSRVPDFFSLAKDKAYESE